VLILVRHGRTRDNASGRLLGRANPELDEVGKRQAEGVADAMRSLDVVRVVSSPLRRAVATAETMGLPVNVDDRWIELDYGAFEGLPIAEVPTETWAAWRSDIHFRPPSGESLDDLARRVASACQDLAEEASANDVVVVSHVSPIKAAVAWALGVDAAATAWRSFVDVASITRVGFGPAGPSLRSFNETAHWT
jgi:broad specificity phosphatase PhoE